MIKIELPEYHELKKIRIIDKAKRKYKENGVPALLFPKDFFNYNEVAGVYILVDDSKVVYVGQTKNLLHRFKTHTFLRKNRQIEHCYLLKEDDLNERLFFELCYKRHYFGKAKIERYCRGI